jgi:hypothetical protein
MLQLTAETPQDAEITQRIESTLCASSALSASAAVKAGHSMFKKEQTSQRTDEAGDKSGWLGYDNGL